MPTLTGIDKPAGAPRVEVPGFPGIVGTFMGRDALSLAASSLGLGQNDWVLLPVYTCQEVIRPFIGRTQVAFYDIEPDLTISPNEVRARLQGRQVKMMLITNYFGFLQPYRNELRQICEEKNICLIEDCAHSLLTQGSGDTGDLTIYSFRKILPLRDGGGLGVNGAGDPPVARFFPRTYSNVLSMLALAKNALNLHSNTFSRARVGSQVSNAVSKVKSSKKNDRVLSLSSFASRKMSTLSFPEVIKRRREDFRFWRETSIKCASLTPVYENLPSGVCPFGFPARVKGRPSLELRARKAGIILGVHWRLDAELGTDCSTSHELSTQILTLPLYPELRESEREILTRILAT